MPEILSDLPRLITVKVRKEFTQNFKSGQDQYIEGHLLGVRCQEGASLQFQVRFQEPGYAGAMFCLPIQAICWKPCGRPPSELVQPWDTFSSNFAVHEFKLLRNSRAWLLNVKKCKGYAKRIEARYLFTLDFQGNALADCFEQHKQLHFLQVSGGWFAAVPNNRLLSDDSAFGKLGEDLPHFESLAADFCGECTFDLP
jgi:hypothetical protein